MFIEIEKSYLFLCFTFIFTSSSCEQCFCWEFLTEYCFSPLFEYFCSIFYLNIADFDAAFAIIFVIHQVYVSLNWKTKALRMTALAVLYNVLIVFGPDHLQACMYICW